MNDAGLKLFIELCLKIKDASLLKNLFELFFTPEEKESIALRVLVIQKLIQQEKTQREIAKELNVSIAKITRGSNELKRMPESLIDFLKVYFRS